MKFKLFLPLIIVSLFSLNVVATHFNLNKVQVNGVEIVWAEIGDPQEPPLVLIQGLMVSHELWGDEFMAGLLEQGYHIIVLDNRDVGESQRMTQDGDPVMWWNLLKAKIGIPVTAPYTLYDMGDDVIALMDTLNIEYAHVMGASMGGMIAQIIAAKHPELFLSLISIMSTTSAPHLPKASEKS